MIRRPLAFALAMALLPLGASAEDLMQTYDLARNSDPQFAAAESQNLVTHEGAVQARAALLPQVGASAQYDRNFPRGSRTAVDEAGNPVIDPVTGAVVRRNIPNSSSRTFGANASQVLFDWSKFNNLKSQRALGMAGDFQLVSAGHDLITRTSQAYFNVLVALETLGAAEAQEASLKKQFDYSSKRLEVGLAPITDVYESQAQYDGARANTIQTRNALEDAYQALTEITGTDIRQLKALPQDFQPQLPSDKGVDDWIADALANNPDLKAGEYNVESANAGIQSARGGHLPTLSLGGGYNDSKTLSGISTTGSDRSRGSSVNLSLNVPIYAGGAIQSGVRQAVANRDIAQDNLEQTRRALIRNTRNAYQTLRAGIAEVEARKAAVMSAREAYKASQVGLEVGTQTILNVLINQQNLFSAEQAYAQSRYNFLQNRLLLVQATGALKVEDVADVNRLLTVDASTQTQQRLRDSQPDVR